MEFEAFKRAVAKVLGMDPDEIDMDMTFLGDLGADSLDLYQIVMEVEDELNISIPKQNLDSVSTVREAVEIIEKL